MTFKQFARLKRTEAGLSQQACALALGMSDRAAFLKLESDHYYNYGWSLKNLLDFARLLGKNASELLAEYEQI